MIILRNSYFSENNKEEVLKEAKRIFKRDLTKNEKDYYSGKETTSQKRKRRYNAFGRGAFSTALLGGNIGHMVNLTKGYVDYDCFNGKIRKNIAKGALIGLAAGIPLSMYFNKKIKKKNESNNSKVRLLRLQRGVTDMEDDFDQKKFQKELQSSLPKGSPFKEKN